MSDSELTAEQKQIVAAVDEHVVKFLKVRYKVIIIVCAILSPVIGLLGGAVFENKYFASTRDKILEDAKQASKEREQEIATITKEARDYLTEIRATRESLNVVLTGTTKGEIAFLQTRSKELESAIFKFEEQLKDWEKRVNNDVPQGLRELGQAADDLKRLQDAVQRLNLLFKENEEAGALAGAFYKIYELLGVLEVTLYVPNTINQQDLELIKKLDGQVSANISLFRKEQEKESSILAWTSITPQISVTGLDMTPPSLPDSPPQPASPQRPL